jgi:hypothetical protein
MINERDYQGGSQKDVEFFVGTEVEHSPAHGLKTLFVVGLQSTDKIAEALSDDIQHIYFGANQSFDLGNNDAEGWQAWEDMINHFMHMGYLCTLDLSTDQIGCLHEGGLVENNLFIPMISVKLPYTRLFNYNTTVKIDDIGFNATNPGVWCWSLRDLMDRERFTDWRAYQQDQPLE